ncbi:iron-containing alcohol dehydrogenase [Thermanaerosceptrum fracticalcis]|uniref:iron-containing alcohol dehydrogenase n=1 Tax=Thermanaerosceptrum fracticalcis TaxID=1712410 RepID=UPI00137713E6|nr:iron-containing alcohol dehydrogenase [Thermanaerosceptrum fracticalcis]
MFTVDNGFSFDARLNIRFKAGIVKNIGKELSAMGIKNVLIVTDPGVLKVKLHENLVTTLNQENIKFEVFSEVEPNPRDTTCEKAAEFAKELNVDAVIGIGGGSSLDTAKCVGFLMTNPGRVKDYDGSGKVKNEPIPIIAIPTTAGTGSEVTANAAITDTEKHIKMSVRSPKIIPHLAVLDPELLKTLPQHIAAFSAMDALIHAIESFLSRRATAFSDYFNLKAIELLSKYIRPFYAEPSNTEAAGNMLIGSMLAGLGISNTGTGNAHALGRVLGGSYDMAHGLACSVVFPYVLKFNAMAQPQKFVEIARAMDLKTEGLNEKEIGQKVVREIYELLRELNIPVKLSELNVTKESFNDMVKVAITNVAPNPRKTTEVDLVSILEEAF